MMPASSPRLALAAAAIACFAGAVNAASLQFVGTNAAWTDSTGGDNVTADNSDPLTPEISWGGIFGGAFATSSYVFETSDPVPDPGVDVDTEFVLGTFTHNNFTIPSGSAISSATLTIGGDIWLDGAFQKSVEFLFHFDHDETANNADPCPGGDTIPCGDLVTTSLLSASDTFTVGGIKYTLDILGFVQGGSVETEFFSDEGASNSADIIGIFTAMDVPQVPLPASGLLLVAGLGTLILRRRRS